MFLLCIHPSIHQQGCMDEKKKIKELHPRRLHNSQTLWRAGVGRSWLMSQFMSRPRVIIRHNISPLQRSPKWVHTYSGAHVTRKHFLPVTFCHCDTDTKLRRTGNDRLSISPLYWLLNHDVSTWWRAVTVFFFFFKFSHHLISRNAPVAPSAVQSDDSCKRDLPQTGRQC